MSSSEEDVLRALSVLSSCNVDSLQGFDKDLIRTLLKVQDVVNGEVESSEDSEESKCIVFEDAVVDTECVENIAYLEQRLPGPQDAGLLNQFSAEIANSDHMFASQQGSFASASAAVDTYHRNKSLHPHVLKALKKQIEQEYQEVSRNICEKVLDNMGKVLASGLCRTALEKPVHVVFTMPDRLANDTSMFNSTNNNNSNNTDTPISIQQTVRTNNTTYNGNVVTLLPKNNSKVPMKPMQQLPHMSTNAMVQSMHANAANQPSKPQNCPILKSPAAVMEHLHHIYTLQKPYPYYAMQQQQFTRAPAPKLPLYSPLPVSIQSMFPSGAELVSNLDIHMYRNTTNEFKVALSSTLSRCLNATTSLPLALYTPPALLARNNGGYNHQNYNTNREQFLSWCSYRVNMNDTTLITAQLMQACGLDKKEYDRQCNLEPRTQPAMSALAPVPKSFTVLPTASFTDLATIQPQMIHHSNVCTGVTDTQDIENVENKGNVYDMTELTLHNDASSRISSVGTPAKRSAPKPITKREQVKKQLQNISKRNGVIGDWDILSYGPGAEQQFKFVPNDWVDEKAVKTGKKTSHALHTVASTASIPLKTCVTKEQSKSSQTGVSTRSGSVGDYPTSSMENPASLSITSVPSYANQDIMTIDSTLLVPLTVQVEAVTNFSAATVAEPLQIQASLQEHDLRSTSELNIGEHTMIPVSLEVFAETVKTISVPQSHFQVWHGTGEVINNTSSYYLAQLDNCIQQHIRGCQIQGCSSLCKIVQQAYNQPASDVYCDLLSSLSDKLFIPANAFQTFASLNAATLKADKVALEMALLHSTESHSGMTDLTSLGVDGLLNIVRNLPIEDNIHIEVALTGPVQLRGDAPLSCYEQASYRGLLVKMVQVMDSPQFLYEDDDEERKMREQQQKNNLEKQQVVDLYKDLDEQHVLKRVEQFLFGNVAIHTALPSPNEPIEEPLSPQPLLHPNRSPVTANRNGFFRDLLQEPKDQVQNAVNDMISGATGSIQELFGKSVTSNRATIAVSPASTISMNNEQGMIYSAMRHAPSLTIEAIAACTPMPIEIQINKQSSQQLAVHSLFTSKAPAMPSLKFILENRVSEQTFYNNRKYENAACICLTCRVPSVCASCCMKCHYKHRLVTLEHVLAARNYVKCCAALTELYQNKYITSVTPEWVWPPGALLPEQTSTPVEIHNLSLLSVSLLLLLNSAKEYQQEQQEKMFLESVPSLSGKSRAYALQLPDWALYTNYDSDILHHRVLPKALPDVYRTANDKQDKYGQKCDQVSGIHRILIEGEGEALVKEKEAPVVKPMKRCLCDGGCGWPAMLQPWDHVDESTWDESTMLLKNRRCQLFSSSSLNEDPVYHYEQDENRFSANPLNVPANTTSSTISTLPSAPAPGLEPRQVLENIRRNRSGQVAANEAVQLHNDEFDDLDTLFRSTQYL